MSCPACGAALPDAARFCPTCGTPTAPTGRSDERRIVTVLFADVVGYTSFAERRDPELVKRLIDTSFAQLAGDIASFGGTVDKILGDGIVALFGAPIAHEDDAERAVRAALAMQATVREVSIDGSHALQLRIGVNTGEVLVGSFRAGGDSTVMGDVVNTAARLQTQAPPGGVLVGDATRALTADAISYEQCGELDVRGRDQPVHAWLATGAVVPPGHRHHATAPLVGRDHELELMLGGISLSVERRRAFLVAIEGEGGVGKSRVLTEAIAAAQQAHDISALEGTCVPYGQSSPWWPVGSALATYVDFDAQGGSDTARSMAVERAMQLLGKDAVDADIIRLGDAFVHLLGLPSPLDDAEPNRANDEIVRAVFAVLSARLVKGPLIVSMTDVHWADPMVLRLFEQLLVKLATLPLILLTTSRPDADLAWPPSVGGPYSVLRLRLEPLDRQASLQLARSIVGDAVADETVERLYQHSGGNPLFLEELATMLTERTVNGQPSGQPLELPDSLRALIAARLDRLPLDQRTMLENAAVLGSSGAWQGLVKFGAELGAPATQAALDGLVEAGLLAVDGRRWRFRSESVRDVTYQILSLAVRAQRHVGVARALETRDAAIDEIAHHWSAAAESARGLGAIVGVPANIRERAADVLIDAARSSLDNQYLRAAHRLSDRGVALLDSDAGEWAQSRRRQLLLLRAEAFVALRQHDRAAADLEVVLATAIGTGDVRSEAAARRVLGDIARIGGDVAGARSETDAAIRLFESLGDDTELARALRNRGMIDIFLGEPRLAGPFLDRADALYGELGDQGGHAWVEQHRAWASFLAGDLRTAERQLNSAAELMSESGDAGGVAWAHGLLAYVRFYEGRREEAAQICRRVLGEATDRGDVWAMGMMESLQAHLLLWDGRIRDAIRLAEAARSRFRQLGDRNGELQALGALIRGSAALGRSTDVRRMAEEITSIGDGFGQQSYAAMLNAGSAVHGGNGRAAADFADAAMELGDARDSGVGRYDVLVIRALASLMLGDGAAAETSLREAQESVSPSQPPFGGSVQALASALVDDVVTAQAHAEAVIGDGSATYLDRIYALIALAAVRMRSGDVDGARRAARSAHDTVASTDDALASGLVRRVQLLVGDSTAVADGSDELALGDWSVLLDALSRSSEGVAS